MELSAIRSRQDIFDFICDFAAYQRGPARRKNGTCLYRAPQADGTTRKCFIGALLPDELYTPSFDEVSTASGFSRVLRVLPLNIILAADDHQLAGHDVMRSFFLGALQSCHDGASFNNGTWTDVWGPNGIATRLKEFGDEFSLSTTSLYRFIES